MQSRKPMTARPTIYRGIAMRSRTEARYASWLDTWCAWQYEPFAFRDMTGEWLVDFRLEDIKTSWGRTPGPVFVEVKPGLWLDEISPEERRMVLARMAAAFHSDPDAVCILEQSGAPGAPQIVRLDDNGTPATTPARWLVGRNGQRVLGMVEDFEWGAWDGRAAA